MLDDPSLQVDVRLRIEAGNALGQMEDPRLKRDMVRIPAGEFLMGTPPEAIDQIWEMFKGTGFEKKWLEWETPQRTVYLDAFEIDRYPVTNAEYKAFVDVKGHRPPPHWQGKDYPSDKANHPVVNVSWLDAKAYADWAGKRLPTEAEWERAARGSDGRLWPWGDDWKEDHCNSEEAGVGDTTPVGIFPKGRRQEEGTEDMAGNVWEWCADWFAEDAYRSGKRENPVGPDRGDYRVLRGGSFYSSKGWVRCAYRLGFDPPFRINYYAGFRCAR
jgi:iron(II)-dependent oxidoreductase